MLASMRLDGSWAATLLCVVACGSGSGGTSGGSGAGGGSALGDVPSCSGAPSQGVIKVQGTLGGQTVNVDQSPVAAGFSQLATGEFDAPLGLTIDDASVGGDSSGVQIHLMWSGAVADGDSAGATGTIELPAGSPDAQMSLCAGSGSKIAPNEANNGLDFVLDGLTLGPACKQAVAGELRGCWGYTNQ